MVFVVYGAAFGVCVMCDLYPISCSAVPDFLPYSTGFVVPLYLISCSSVPGLFSHCTRFVALLCPISCPTVPDFLPYYTRFLALRYSIFRPTVPDFLSYCTLLLALQYPICYCTSIGRTAVYVFVPFASCSSVTVFGTFTPKLVGIKRND